jgi:hypothetical protein
MGVSTYFRPTKLLTKEELLLRTITLKYFCHNFISHVSLTQQMIQKEQVQFNSDT